MFTTYVDVVDKEEMDEYAKRLTYITDELVKLQSIISQAIKSENKTKVDPEKYPDSEKNKIYLIDQMEALKVKLE